MEEVIQDAIDKYKNVNEVYEIVKSFEFAIQDRGYFRINVLKDHKDTHPGSYTARWWQKNDAGTFVDIYFTWIDATTPELALRQAINLLVTGNL